MQRGLEVPEISEFASTTGFGVSALVDGRRVLVGRPGRPSLLFQANTSVGRQ